jgi:hypothetical protein
MRCGTNSSIGTWTSWSHDSRLERPAAAVKDLSNDRTDSSRPPTDCIAVDAQWVRRNGFRRYDTSVKKLPEICDAFLEIEWEEDDKATDAYRFLEGLHQEGYRLVWAMARAPKTDELRQSASPGPTAHGAAMHPASAATRNTSSTYGSRVRTTGWARCSVTAPATCRPSRRVR